MAKTVIFVMDSINLTSQVVPSFTTQTHKVIGMTSASFGVGNITNIGPPSEVPLIQFYLAAGTQNQYQVIRELNSLGYIISIALNPGGSNSSNSYCYNLGLSTAVERWDSSHLSSFYTYQNTVLNNTVATDPGTYVEFKPNGNNFGASIPDNKIHPDFVKIARLSPSDSNISFGYLPKGTQVNNGFTLKAPIIFAGFLYTSSSVLPIFSKIVQDIYDFCDLQISPPFKVEGKVRDTDGLPLVRSLRLYKQSTGMWLGSTESKEDGTYSIGVLNEEFVYIVCAANDLTKRNQIIGPILPIAST